MSEKKSLDLKFKPVGHFDGLDLPSYETSQSAGMDVRAAIIEPVELKPLQRYLVPTGLTVEIPEGYEMQVRPRSGLAWKHGITVLNTPGTIDSDYRGEIKVILVNLSDESFKIERGDRIAQLVLASVVQAQIEVAAELSETKRGDGGFGHTGKR